MPVRLSQKLQANQTRGCLRRRGWLLGTTAIGLACVLGVALPALAADECGAIVNGAVSCSPAGNNYTSGITYNPAEDLTMVVQDGVTITPSSGNQGIDVTFSASGLYDLDLRLYDSDAETDITTTGTGAEGIFIRNARNVVLYNEADIAAANDAAIEVRASNDVTIKNAGTISGNGRAVEVIGGPLQLTNSGRIESSLSGGVYVRLGGDSTIVLTQSSEIETLSHGVYVLAPTSFNNSIYISNSGSIITTGGDGIRLGSIDGYSEIVQSSTGSILTEGDSTHGIFLNSTQNYAEISVDGLITTTGDYSSAIRADSVYADLTVSVSGDLVTEGIASHGIYVSRTTGYVDVTMQGSIVTSGNGSSGIFVDDTVGNVDVTMQGSILTHGRRSPGIYVIDTIGNATISALGDIITHGTSSAAGIGAKQTTGDVEITSGDITADHSIGIYVGYTTGNVSVTATGSLVTGNTGNNGILISYTDGHVNVSVSETGRIETDGDDAHGIAVGYTRGTAGADYVDALVEGSIITYGDNSHGIYAHNNDGNVTISLSASGSIETDNGHGIFVYDTGDGIGGDYVTVQASGDIAIHGNYIDGIHVEGTVGAVDVTVAGTITTYYYGSRGISVENIEGSVGVTVSGDVVTGQYYNSRPSADSNAHGVYLNTTGSALVTLSDTGSITTYGSLAPGVLVEGTTGTATVVADGVITTHGGDSPAILLFDNQGDVNVTASGSIVTWHYRSPGIYSLSTGEDVTITSYGEITTHGGFAHGIAVHETTGDLIQVIMNGRIQTYDSGSAGVSADGNEAEIDIRAAGSIYTDNEASHGIQVLNNLGKVNVTTSGGLIETRGPSSRGMYIRDSYGDVTVSSGGTITTHNKSSYGIELSGNDFAVDVILSGNISTALYYAGRPTDKSFAAGIAVTDTGGLVTIQLLDGSVITTYGSQGPGIKIENALQASVDVDGSIVTHGNYSSGISINTVTGDVAVNVLASGTITALGAQSDGISIANTSGVGNVTVAGSIMGGWGNGAGIALDNPNAISSGITIGDTGTLGALSDIAIRAVEPVTINNAGTITGYLSLGDGDDSFTNTGTWYLRNHADTNGDGERDTEGVATADFGGGEDQIVNTGTLSLSKGTASLWQGEIVHLESFTHGGTIELEDGVAGDTLSISGNFKSDGGSLLLDAVLDDGSSSRQADTLTLENVSLLSASTKIFVANAGGLGVLGDTGILLVDADFDDSGGGAFTLGQAVIGAYEYELHYDDAADTWYLRNLVTDTGAPSIFSGTEEYPALMTAALLSFASDWSALHNRLSDGRFSDQDLKIEPAAWTGSNARPRPWLQVHHARQEIAAGAAFEQDVVKFAAGADVPFALGNGGTALIGAFLGLGRNQQDFDSSATEAVSDVALGGLYASYRRGGFHANAIAKYEYHQAEVKNEATNEDGSSFDIDLWGGSVETGYRFAFASSYLQPRLRFNSVQAGSTSFEDASSTGIALESADSLAGEAAARLGFLFDTGEIYLDGGARHEFLGDTEASVSGLSFSDALPGTAGFIAGGLALHMVEGKVLLALEGGYAKGNEGEEITASAALRVMY